VTLNVVDVVGNFPLTRDVFGLFAKKNPNRISNFTFTQAPAPELPAS